MRRPILILLALAAVVGLAACGSSARRSSTASSASGSSTVSTVEAAAHEKGPTLRVGDQAGTGAEALLKAAGLLHKLPFNVQFADFTSGPPIIQAISAGSLDIGNTGDAPPVFAAAGGDHIKIVGALSNAERNVALLVPRDSSIKTVAQLKGKKIAVAQGSSADYHLLWVLHQAGLSPRDVQLVYLQPAEGYTAFESGAVAAWDVWPPFSEQAQIDKGARKLVGGQGFPGNNSFEVASDAAIADPARAREITEYLKLLDRAHVWANTHPDQWAATWGAATGLPAGIMDAAAADTIQTPVPVNTAITSDEQGLVKLFAGAGLIPKDYSFAPFTTSQFNASVN